MNQHPPAFVNGRAHFSATELETAIHCPRKFLLGVLLRLEPSGSDKWKMDYGAAWHEIVSSLWKSYRRISSISANAQEIMTWYCDDAIPAVLKHYWASDIPMPSELNEGMMQTRLWDYFHLWSRSELEICTVKDAPAVELRGILPFACIGEMEFHIDAIVRMMNDSSRRFVLDHKSTSHRLYANWSSNYVNSPQMLAYATVLHRLFDDLKDSGGYVIDRVSFANLSKSSCAPVDMAVYNCTARHIGLLVKTMKELAVSMQEAKEHPATIEYRFAPRFCDCTTYGGCQFLPLCYPDMCVVNVDFDEATQSFVGETPPGFSIRPVRRKPMMDIGHDIGEVQAWTP